MSSSWRATRADAIRQCEPPRLLEVTFGAENNVVTLRLTPDGAERTALELVHSVPVEMGREDRRTVCVRGPVLWTTFPPKTAGRRYPRG
ncbi:MAG: hypothetical protein LH603_03345 [Pseudonocardia sp.]|nr:hypothetical protein [Pseudonocardia sp.]